jgi:hypothetical protein
VVVAFLDVPVVVAFSEFVDENKRVELLLVDGLDRFLTLADDLDIVEFPVARGGEVWVSEVLREGPEDDADSWVLEAIQEVLDDNGLEDRSKELELTLSGRVEEDKDDDASLVCDRVRMIGEGIDCALNRLCCDADVDETTVEVPLSAGVSCATNSISYKPTIWDC